MDLKACPFCGGEAEGLSIEGSMTFKEVMCNGCDCIGPLAKTPGNWRDPEQQTVAEQEAISAWNRRAAITPDPENDRQLKAVEKALAAVPHHFFRENEEGAETVWEICRYGFLTEPEIVVICGYARQQDAEERIYDVIGHARARAVLTALRDLK